MSYSVRVDLISIYNISIKTLINNLIKRISSDGFNRNWVLLTTEINHSFFSLNMGMILSLFQNFSPFFL